MPTERKPRKSASPKPRGAARRPAGSDAPPDPHPGQATGEAEAPRDVASPEEVFPEKSEETDSGDLLEVEPAPEALAEVEEELGADGPEIAALAPREERGLVRRDPLQAYMAEVHRHPLLTREQEHELAVRYRQTGDLKAAARLVASNLRLVVKLAHEYHRNPLSLLDLVQEGNIGLMQAVKKYDPDRGVKLSSYAAWWIWRTSSGTSWTTGRW